MCLRALLIVLLGAGTLIGPPTNVGLAAPVGLRSAGVADLEADFNGDGFADLSVGVPGEDVAGVLDAGAVSVLYGAAGGLQATAPPDQLWHRAALEGAAGAEDHFGAALAFGDFNGDGFDDLAIGTPDDDMQDAVDGGRVSVVYGSSVGLTAAGNQLWDQSAPGVRGRAEDGDRFGSAVAAHDYNGDGFDDLAAGVPGDLVGEDVGAGAVAVLYGSGAGIQATSPDDQLWTQDSAGVKEEAAPGDGFGGTVTSGDFNNDGFADLAAAAPRDDTSGMPGAGVVIVLYGSFGGLQAGRQGPEDQFWTQDSGDVLDDAEVDDEFGRSLARGDFNADGFDDLVIGVPLEDIDVNLNAGGANVLYGSVDGLTAVGNQFWSQEARSIIDAAELEDHFATAVAAGDFNGDGFDELAVGVPGEAESIGVLVNAGAINVIIGSATGLTAAGNQFWTQDSPGIGGTREEGDLFGASLAAGDFGKGAQADLSIGVPGDSLGEIAAAGLVDVFYGSAEGLSAAGDQAWSQNTADVEEDSEADDGFGSALTA